MTTIKLAKAYNCGWQLDTFDAAILNGKAL